MTSAPLMGLGVIAGPYPHCRLAVLPAVPVLLASAINAHRWGALALGAGIGASFTSRRIFLPPWVSRSVSIRIRFRVVAP